MTNRIILATICLVLAFATNEINAQENGFKKRQIGNIFYLDLPDYMTRAFGLNDIADAQYQSPEKEAYTIIIEEEKEDIRIAGGGFANAKEYFEFFIKSFGIDSLKITLEEETKAGKFLAYQGQINGMVENMNLFYLVTIVESPAYFYNIISWTLKENQEKLIDDFKKIATSLKEN